MRSLIFCLLFLMIFIFGCSTQNYVACTEDAKLCPDGSSVGRVGPNCEFAECPSEANMERVECDADSRLADFCTQEYDPVCGWFSEKIQCIKYPCASTYSNGCAACKNADVSYYTKGECLE